MATLSAVHLQLMELPPPGHCWQVVDAEHLASAMTVCGIKAMTKPPTAANNPSTARHAAKRLRNGNFVALFILLPPICTDLPMTKISSGARGGGQ
jgi:hypothetical protein